LSVHLNGVDVGTTRIRLRTNGDQGVNGLSAAADGSMSQGAITFEDSDSTLTIAGWDTVLAAEPECIGATRLFTGYVADRTERRGHYVTTNGREIDTTLNDTNVLLANIVVTGSDGNRPAETDADTIAWLLSTYLSGIVYDLGFVNPPPRDFDPADYRTMSCAEILAALVAPRGQIFFTYWDQSANKIGLFYDAPTSTTFTSTLSISNVLGDVDNVSCFAPYIDDEQYFDPSEVYCQIDYLYKGGRLLTHNATTHAAFFAGIGHRTLVVENDRVGLRTTAQTFSDRILTQASTERPLLRFTVLLPATKVGLIQAGMRLAVRFSHLTGFTASTYTRVERLTVAPVASNDHLYEMNLECSTHGPITPIGGGGTGGVPLQPPIAAYVQRVASRTTIALLPNNITAGDLVTVEMVERGGPVGPTGPGSSAGSGWTLVDTVQVEDDSGNPKNIFGRLYWKIADGNEGNEIHNAQSGALEVIEWASGCTFGTFASKTLVPHTATMDCGGTISVSPGDYVIGFAAIGQFDAISGTYTLVPAANVTVVTGYLGDSLSPDLWVGDIPSGGSGYVEAALSNPSSPIFDNWAGITFSVAGGSTSLAPMTGQWTEWAVVTMSGATGTTLFPYTTGSLEVKVDGVLISPASYTETDNTTGAFTLSWSPDTDEVVTVRYQGI
jgi:hypothetical protein